MYDILVMLAEERLGGRAHDKALGEMILSADSNYSTFGRKAVDVILLLLEQAFGDKHRHIYVLVSESLESCVEVVLDILPNSVSVGADDHTALNARVIYQLCLFYNVGVPLSKINVH